VSALRSLAGGRGSLNEALFVDRGVRRRVGALVAEAAPDVVVLDSLRLSGAVAGVTAPVVVDLDDLLSVRYERLRTTARSDPRAVLGFAAARVPAPLRGAAARAAVLLLGWEARRMAVRERQVSAAADAVSLVSRSEAALLAERTGRDVAWLPPAVPVPAEPVEPRDGLVFLGGLDYLPNLQALRFHRDEVLPRLDAGDPRHVLHVVGHCPDDARAELDVPGIVLHGYTDDLHAALGRRLLVAPLVAGGGVKLKVLDAMAHGLPVAGMPGAFEGLGLPDDLELQAGDGAALAALVRELVGDPERCRRTGARAREVVRREFTTEAAARRWDALLARLG
jgi:hypothetical protein